MRSRAGERRLAGTTLALGDLADDAGVGWAAQAAERDIALSVRRTRDPGTVWAARSDIERALDALIENALRYSAAGTEVVIAASPCTIEIRDRGRGVAPGEQDLVFERARRGFRRSRRTLRPRPRTADRPGSARVRGAGRCGYINGGAAARRR